MTTMRKKVYNRDFKIFILTLSFCICFYNENYLMGIFVINYINMITS